MKNFHLMVAFVAVAASGARATPVEIIPPGLRGGQQPQVAVSADGRISVVFGKSNTIYYTASGDGRIFSTPVKVGELDKLALGMGRGPRICDAGKLLVVTAISHTDGNVHAWTSPDGGTTWRQGAKINDSDKSTREGLHAMAGDGKGFVLATWLDLRNPGTELWSSTSRDGGATWSANIRVYQSPDGHICECCQPAAAVDQQGHIAVMWRNWLGGARDLYFSTSDDAGETFISPQKLGTGTWPLDGCPMDGGAIALDPAGHPVTAWRREKSVYLAGGPQLERLVANEAAHPGLALHKNTIHLVWEQNGGLMLQRGTALPMHLAEKASYASIAVTPDGAPIVVWESSTTQPATLLAERLK